MTSTALVFPPVPADPAPPRAWPVARVAAGAGLMVGTAFAAISVYWGFGGTWLLDTVGGGLATQGRAGSAAVLLAVWTAAALKLVASILPMAVVSRSIHGRGRRLVRLLTWVEAVILTGYGLVLTAVGLAVQAGVIPVAASADHHALAWHAYLWDPWFLVWGVLVIVVLVASRPARPGVTY